MPSCYLNVLKITSNVPSYIISLKTPGVSSKNLNFMVKLRPGSGGKQGKNSGWRAIGLGRQTSRRGRCRSIAWVRDLPQSDLVCVALRQLQSCSGCSTQTLNMVRDTFVTLHCFERTLVFFFFAWILCPFHCTGFMRSLRILLFCVNFTPGHRRVAASVTLCIWLG